MAESGRRSGRIAYVLRRFPKLSETFILNEILALEAQGERVCIFALRPTRDSRFHEDLGRLKSPVYYLPDVFELRTLIRHNVRAVRRDGTRYLRALGTALKTGRPTMLWRLLQAGYIADRAARLRIVHLHAHFATRSTNVASLASRLTGIPFSFTAHAMDIYKHSVKRRLLAGRIERAKFVVTVSESNRRYLSELANGATHKIVRVYNGIDLVRFEPNGTPPATPFTILSVARLVEKKGLEVLLEGCRELRNAGVPFRCWIVGKGRLRASLDARIGEWGLREHVGLLGARTQLEVLERYRAAHLFVLPCIVGADGNRDGLPVSIVESLACGVPVVTTPVTGIPEVVEHERNGLLVESGNARALAEAIAGLIRDPARYARLKSNARASVVERFDLRETAQELRELFREGRS